MSIHNISGLPYQTIDDIQNSNIREILKKDPSINVLSVIGHSLCQVLLERATDEHSIELLKDLMVVLSISQSKSNELKVLVSRLKMALNLREIE